MKTSRLLPALIPSLLLGLTPLSACSSPTPTTSSLPASAETRLAKIETDIATINARLSASPDAARASSTASSDPNAVKELRVQPDPVRITPGQTAQLELVLMVLNNDQTSVAKNFNLFGISSSDTSTATVSADGQITGIKAGATVVTVRLGNVSKTVAVIVEAAAATPSPTPTPVASASATPTPSPSPTGTDEVESLTISLLSTSIVVNATTDVQSIYVKLKNGTEGLINNRESVTFESSDTSVATINSSGVITARASGSTTISATYKGFKTTTSLTVTAN